MGRLRPSTSPLLVLFIATSLVWLHVVTLAPAPAAAATIEVTADRALHAGNDTETVAPKRTLFINSSHVTDLSRLQLPTDFGPDAARCPWVVMVYDDMCGHCRATAPLYAGIARDFSHSETHSPRAAAPGGGGGGSGEAGGGAPSSPPQWVQRRGESDAIEMTPTRTPSTAPATLAKDDDADSRYSPFLMAAVNCVDFESVCVDLDLQHGVPAVYMFLPTPAVLADERHRPTLAPVTADTPMNSGLMSMTELVSTDIGLLRLREQIQQVWAAAAPSLGWTAHHTENCMATAALLRQEKLARNAAQGSAAATATPFVEERAVHSIDIANAFYYTMYHEVTLRGLETGGPREALIEFLRAVSQRLPGLNSEVLLYQLQRENLTSVTAWQRFVLESGIPHMGSPRELQWSTCRGSSWQYRGFPCGLWLLYHTLTVNEPAEDVPGRRNVLEVILDYARHYFSCRSCRDHFLFVKVNETVHPAVQLWRAHNVANYNLARGSVMGADPLVPKAQFPPADLCGDCFVDGSYDEAAVLRFLTTHYHWKPVTLTSAPSATETTASPAPDPEEDRVMIVVRKDPLPLNIILTLLVIMVVFVLGMKYAYVRAKRRRLQLRKQCNINLNHMDPRRLV